MAFQNCFQPSFSLETSNKCNLYSKPVMENVVHRLRNREIHISRAGTLWHQQRSFYQSIFPNLTVVSAEKPTGFLKKFTPDGKYLICFCANLNFVQVYEYQGCQAGEELLSGVSGNVLHERNKSTRKTYILAKEKLFSKFFKFQHYVKAVSENHFLNKDFIMFTHDSKYLLVLSTSYPINEGNGMNLSELLTSNESLTPIPSAPLEDYCLHCIDIKAGVRTSSVDFKRDRILTSRNQGLFLYRNTLAVLSIQHQCIYIFKLQNGVLIESHKIGRFSFSTDEMNYSNIFPMVSPSQYFRENAYCVLKNKLLISLFKKASERGKKSLSKFYQHFQFLENLKMWKLQIVDERTLLIKYASQNVLSMRAQEPSILPSFFLFYDFESGDVLSVYENTSSELLEIFQSNPGLFYQAEVFHGNLQVANYDIYSYRILRRFKETIINAKYGGEMEARKRILAQLPVQCQILSPNPYLDLSLFSYDDKYISSVQKAKFCGDHPIRFYSRKSGILRFEMTAGSYMSLTNPDTNGKRFVSFIFHPFEPFAISFARSYDHSVNIHVRHLENCL